MKRLKHKDYYDGSQQSKERLVNLFTYADLNMREFCTNMRKYRQYLVKTFNHLEEDRKTSSIENYSIVANRIIKITEIDNLLDLTRMFYNALIAFDGFVDFFHSYNKIRGFEGWLNNKDLTEIIKILKCSFIAVDSTNNNTNVDIQYILHQARNAFIHTGRFICTFANVPNNANQLVPAVIIKPSDIIDSESCKQHNWDSEICLDALEVMENLNSSFDKIEKEIKLLFKK